MRSDSTTVPTPRSTQHCRRCGRFLSETYRLNRWVICDACDSKLAASSGADALVEAAKTVLSGRTRVGACPFLNSHRDGICSRCLQMAAHDANLPRWVA